MVIRKIALVFAGVCCAAVMPVVVGAAPPDEHVVLLHGLGRSGRSMKALERRFLREGFQVSVIDYPSREKTIGELAGFLKREIVSRGWSRRGRFTLLPTPWGG